MSVNQPQQHPMPRQMKLATCDQETSRFVAISTLGLVIVIVAVTALLARGGGNPRNPEPVRSLGAAAQEPSTPNPVSTPLAMFSGSIAWQLDPALAHSGQDGPIAVSNGRAFQLMTLDSEDDSFDFSGVRAVDLESGDILWQQELEWSRPGLAADAHGVYVVADLQKIEARDPATGEPLWTLDLSVPVASLALDNGVLYLWGADSRMLAVNTTTGESIWQSDSVSDTPFETTPNGAPFSEELQVGGGVIVAMDADSTLHAFSLTDGAIEWTLPGFDWQTTYLYASGDTLLAVQRIEKNASSTEMNPTSPDQHATAIDMFSGRTAWEVIAISPNGWSGSPRQTGMFYVVANSLEGVLPSSESIVDAASSVVWPEWTPTAAERQNYFDGGEHVFALDAATGTIDWQQTTGAGDFYGLGGATSTGIWAVTVDQQLVLLSSESGSLLAPPVPLHGQSVNGLFGGSDSDGLVVRGRGGTLIGIRIDPI